MAEILNILSKLLIKIWNLAVLEYSKIPQIPHLEYRGIAVSVLQYRTARYCGIYQALSMANLPDSQ